MPDQIISQANCSILNKENNSLKIQERQHSKEKSSEKTPILVKNIRSEPVTHIQNYRKVLAKSPSFDYNLNMVAHNDTQLIPSEETLTDLEFLVDTMPALKTVKNKRVENRPGEKENVNYDLGNEYLKESNILQESQILNNSSEGEIEYEIEVIDEIEVNEADPNLETGGNNNIKSSTCKRSRTDELEKKTHTYQDSDYTDDDYNPEEDEHEYSSDDFKIKKKRRNVEKLPKPKPRIKPQRKSKKAKKNVQPQLIAKLIYDYDNENVNLKKHEIVIVECTKRVKLWKIRTMNGIQMEIPKNYLNVLNPSQGVVV